MKKISIGKRELKKAYEELKRTKTTKKEIQIKANGNKLIVDMVSKSRRIYGKTYDTNLGYGVINYQFEELETLEPEKFEEDIKEGIKKVNERRKNFEVITTHNYEDGIPSMDWKYTDISRVKLNNLKLVNVYLDEFKRSGRYNYTTSNYYYNINDMEIIEKYKNLILDGIESDEDIIKKIRIPYIRNYIKIPDIKGNKLKFKNVLQYDNSFDKFTVAYNFSRELLVMYYDLVTYYTTGKIRQGKYKSLVTENNKLYANNGTFNELDGTGIFYAPDYKLKAYKNGNIEIICPDNRQAKNLKEFIENL